MRPHACLAPIALAVLFVLIQFQPAPAQNSPGPSAHLQETTFDAGKVKQGDALVHSFRVLNKGDRDLVIGRVKPG